jgi:hypothetical protein
VPGLWRRARRRPTDARTELPAGAGLDAVTQDDARYFEDHPDEQIRIRPITHAERVEWLWVNDVDLDPDMFICVHSVRPGFRTRIPMVKLEFGDGAA